MSFDLKLHRYWFPASIGFGIGVTAWTEEDARTLVLSALPRIETATLGVPVVDIDIRDLDPGHVIPNIGVCSVRGVWYPNIPLLGD